LGEKKGKNHRKRGDRPRGEWCAIQDEEGAFPSFPKKKSALRGGKMASKNATIDIKRDGLGRGGFIGESNIMSH